MAVIYIAYSRVWPYLPIAIADSPRELGALCGVTNRCVSKAISELKSGRLKTSPYHRVEIEEDEE